MFRALISWLQWQRNFQNDKQYSAEVVNQIERAREAAQVENSQRQPLAANDDQSRAADSSRAR